MASVAIAAFFSKDAVRLRLPLLGSSAGGGRLSAVAEEDGFTVSVDRLTGGEAEGASVSIDV